MPLNDHDDFFDFNIPDDILPTGMQRAVVVEVEKVPGTKAPYLAVQFEIVGGEWDSLVLYHNVTLSKNPFARQRTKASIEAIIGRSLTASENIERLMAEMQNKPCQIQVGKREFEGVMRPNVEKVLPPKAAPGFEEETPRSSGVASLFDEDLPF